MLDKPCPRCGEMKVRKPLVKDIHKPLTLVKCDACNKYSRYVVIRHVDKSRSYRLSLWGNRKNLRTVKRVVRAIDTRHLNKSSEDINSALDEKFSNNV